MDAVKFMDERARMCNACNQCHGCPITDWCGKGLREQAKYSTDIISAVEKWSASHPVKTRQSEFLKQWPNAKIGSEGTVAIDPCIFDTTVRKGRCIATSCAQCRREFWMQEVE